MEKRLIGCGNLARASLVTWLLGVVATSASGQTAVDLPPNLIALPAANVSLVSGSGGVSTLRFSTTSWNSGTGPLEIVAGSVDSGTGKQKVDQRVLLSDGSSFLHQAGWFTYHPQHNHIHFDDYAIYSLQPVNAPGGSSRTGTKTTFCIMDTTKVDTGLPGAPGAAVYSSCGSVVQGMSVGWGDSYGSHLAGQELDFTGNADGIYQLKIDIDPNKRLIEVTKDDNVSCVLLNIKKPNTVTVLDASGSCSTVVSISPKTASMGTTIQVTISGYGFLAGTPISFEGGNGPRPVASNVQLATDTDGLDTLTATVTIPFKKQTGRNPVWDIRVGSGGVLRDAFTVTR